MWKRDSPPPSSRWGDRRGSVPEHDPAVTDAATAPSPEAASDAAVERTRMSGRRRALVWTLIVLASLIGLGSILTTWVHRQVLDNQSWTDASARLIENPEVQDALSVFLVNELYDNVDVAAGLQQRLPANLKPLATPIAAALRQPPMDGVQQLPQAPRRTAP